MEVESVPIVQDGLHLGPLLDESERFRALLPHQRKRPKVQLRKGQTPSAVPLILVPNPTDPCLKSPAKILFNNLKRQEAESKLHLNLPEVGRGHCPQIVPKEGHLQRL